MQNLETRIENDLKRIGEMSERTAELVRKFDAENKAMDLAAATRKNNTQILRLFMYAVKKPIEDINKDDLVNFLSGDKYSKGSLNNFKAVLCKFFKWYNDGESLPENLKGAKKILKQSLGVSKVPKKLLSAEDVKKLAAAATNPRDRLIPLFLFESGCRLGEILGIRLSDIEFDEYGCKVSLRGKTGERKCRMIDCAPNIRELIENHPYANDKDAMLFTLYKNTKRNDQEKKHPVMTGTWLRYVLIQLAKRAGMDIRIYPHLFRHSAATVQASELTEWELRTQFGWAMGSPTPAVYVHRSGINLDRKKLANRGLIDLNGKSEKKETLELIACPACQTKNGPVARFCYSCGQGLDAEAMQKYREEKLGRIVLGLIQQTKEGPSYLEKLMQDHREEIKQKV